MSNEGNTSHCSGIADHIVPVIGLFLSSIILAYVETTNLKLSCEFKEYQKWFNYYENFQSIKAFIAQRTNQATEAFVALERIKNRKMEERELGELIKQPTFRFNLLCEFDSL